MGWDLVLDVKCRANRFPMFPPVGGRLAPEIVLLECRTDNIPGELRNVGGRIPGYRLRFDIKAKKAEILDRLMLEEEKETLVLIRRELNTERMFYQRLGDKFVRTGPDEDACVECDVFQLGEQPPNNLATWLYHCRIMADDGKFVEKKGTIPELNDIMKLGTIWQSDSWGLQPKTGQPDLNLLHPPGHEQHESSWRQNRREGVTA